MNKKISKRAERARKDRRATTYFYVKFVIVLIALFVWTDWVNTRFDLHVTWYGWGFILGFIYIILKGLTDLGT